MRHLYVKIATSLGLLLFASLLVPLSAASPARAGETIDYPSSGTLREPQRQFGFSSARDTPMPATANSLFPVNDPSSNVVKVTGANGDKAVTGHVFGGIAPKVGITSRNNQVTISNSNIGLSSGGGNVTGGWALDGDVQDNTVSIDNGSSTVRGIVFGGWIRGDGGELGQGGGDAIHNIVNIGSGSFKSNVYGAYVQTGGGKLERNEVNISGGTLDGTGGIIAGAYSSLANNAVTDNEVKISGGTFKGARNDSEGYSIYGGRGQSGSEITKNSVTIDGATLINSTIYGGQNIGGSGKVADNEVSIGGSAAVQLANAAVYGGYSGSGAATLNRVTLGQYAAGNISSLLGGYASRNNADAFSGNTLTKISAISVVTAGNFETVNFDYTGDANIGALSTTATGVSNPGARGVTIDSDANIVNFGGVITGSGTLTKKGAGSLILTNDGNHILNSYGVFVNAGTLQLGDGGTTGNLFTEKYDIDGTLAYNRSNAIWYGGGITGTGTLAQNGTGTLILTGDNNAIGKVTITKGTLQLGDGGASGSITTGAAGIAIDSGAALAYSHSNAIADTNKISGAGKVIQRGSGALTLNNTGNDFAGGTEIESGALNIVSASLGETKHGSASNAGFVTFTGGGGKNVFISGDVASLNNSFRTATGAGSSNTVTIAEPTAPSGYLSINGNKNSREGGVFYVAPGTAMDVHNNSLLLLTENKATGGSGEYSNDLYVADGGTFNLYTNDYTRFVSGINKGGAGSALNLFTSANAVLNPRIDFINNNTPTGSGATPPIFQMGKTTVTGAVDKGMTLVVGRMVPEDNPSPNWQKRTEFKNDTSFTIQGLAGGASLTAAALAGDGIIQAGTDTGLGAGVDKALSGSGGVITVRNGAVLIPTALEYVPPDYGMEITYGTLTLNAEKVSLIDFGYIYQPGAKTTTPDDPSKPEDTIQQVPLDFDAQDVPDSNHSLVNIVSAGKAVMGNGQVAIVSTHKGDSFAPGQYLLMRSNNGFVTPDGVTDITSGNIGNFLTVTVDGFEIKQANEALRGSYGLTMGGDPDLVTGKMLTDTTNNVWLGQSLNSLSMAWTGGAAGNQTSPQSGNWADTFGFTSLQEDLSTHQHETGFMPGDKVYISGNDSVTIDLTRIVAQGASKAANVSGLVVGKEMAAGDAGSAADTGIYTISDGGGGYGIAAYDDIAIGRYAAASYSESDKLEQTGKLEKYGPSTLRFANSGANTFTEGIDLYGGTTQFFRADQLGDGGKGITFKKDTPSGSPNEAILEALANVTLETDVSIGAAFTGAFGATTGTTFNYAGALTGDNTTTLDKTGAGTVRLSAANADPSPFAGKVDVRAGLLDVAANYGAATGFAVQNGAILSGAGIFNADGGFVAESTLGGGGEILAGGLLKPGGLVWPDSGAPEERALNLEDGDVAFKEGGGFAVRLAEYYDSPFKRYSDLVNVSGNGDAVSIDPAANLAVDVDYFKLDLTDTKYYTIIDDTRASATDSGKFHFNANHYLPRGVSLEHGWGLDGIGGHYNIGLIRYNPGDGYSKIPGGTHNETEIGKTVDWVVENQDPSLPDIIDRLTGDDEHVLKQLDQLHGDLAANALYMAFKEPWRHPFNRLDAALAFNRSGQGEQGEQSGEPALHTFRGWVETSSRYQSVDYDGNAHGFTLYRHGAAFGMDTMISPRAIVGAAFRYTRPHLEQATGEVDADDFEAGLYGLAGLSGGLNMKAYLGYSWQEYDLSRRVSLDAPPGNLAAGAWKERLNGETSGHAVAASLEITRPIQTRENFRLVPVAALDYEKVWLDGFRETGGQAALRYGDASMDRLTARAGLKGEYAWNDRLDLKAWAQYARHIGGRDYPEIDARFTAVSKPGQPAADIHGSRTGRYYVNLGVGANWALGERGDKFLYMNYDAKLNSRMTDHAGEIGFMMRF